MAISNTERIIGMTDKDLRDDAIEMMSEHMDSSKLVNDCASEIVNHKDFATEYSAIIDNVLSAERDMIPHSDVSIMLNPDVDVRLMRHMMIAFNSNVEANDVQFVLDQLQANIEKYPRDDAYSMADAMLTCMSSHMPITNEMYQQYTPAQLYELDEICNAVCDNSESYEKRISQEPGHSTVGLDRYSYQKETFDTLKSVGCFDPDLSADQMRAIGGILVNEFKDKSYVPAHYKETAAAIDVIKDHKANYDMYRVVVDLKDQKSPEDLWTAAKIQRASAVVDDSMSYIGVPDINMAITPPGALRDVLDHIYNAIGIDYDQAPNLVPQMMTEREMSGENMANKNNLLALTNMMLDGISPQDALDYLSAMPEYKPFNLDAVSACTEHNIPKELTIQCLKEELSQAKLQEVFCGIENGLSVEQVMSYCDDSLSIMDMCKARLKLEGKTGKMMGDIVNGASKRAEQANSDHKKDTPDISKTDKNHGRDD